MKRARPAAGGGRLVEVAPDRLVGWLARFAVRNEGASEPAFASDGVIVRGGNGSMARIVVPFGPLQPQSDHEPVESVLAHVAGLGVIGIIAVRAGAHSAGLARDGQVLRSSTDRHYVQGRTAAGGWSQQRFARRRANQKEAAWQDAADDAARVLLDPAGPRPDALVLAGDAGALQQVLADGRLAVLVELPRRVFGDIPEPRRAVLDELAVRCRTLEITIVGG